ncbi:uncharacterized protein LOC143041541 isoform X2 [Oratosquilla oratoria]
MSSGACPVTFTQNLLVHFFLIFLLMVVYISQSILLDAYIIAYNHTSVHHYFWLVPDFMIMFGLVGAMGSAYRFKKKLYDKPIKRRSSKKLSRIDLWLGQLFGLHPMSFMSWILYSLMLIAKVGVIIRFQIHKEITSDNFLSPQLFMFLMAATCFVFLVLITGHLHSQKDIELNPYIRALTIVTCLEILDAVSLLSQFTKNMNLSSTFENVILGFGSTSFFLPAITLYKLSLSDYGRGSTNILASFFFRLFCLCFINIPYLLIRIHLWYVYKADVCVFVVKNVIYIFTLPLAVWSQALEIYVIVKAKFVERSKTNDSTSVAETELDSISSLKNTELDFIHSNTTKNFQDDDVITLA